MVDKVSILLSKIILFSLKRGFHSRLTLQQARFVLLLNSFSTKRSSIHENFDPCNRVSRISFTIDGALPT